MFGNLIKMRAYFYDLFFKTFADGISVPSPGAVTERENIYLYGDHIF